MLHCTGGEGSKRCEVKEGPGKGGTCVFPFTFKGKEYTTCTAEGTGKQYNIGSWCPTVVGIVLINLTDVPILKNKYSDKS
jgi:hypothetical protein